MWRLPLGLLPLIAVFALSGCSSKPRIVGTWTATYETAGAPVSSEGTFHSDGRYTNVAMIGGQAARGIRAIDTGAWKIEGDDKLTITVADIVWEPVGTDPAQTQKIKDRFQSSKATILAEANKMGKMTLKWNGSDEYSVVIEGQTYTYRRKK